MRSFGRARGGGKTHALIESAKAYLHDLERFDQDTDDESIVIAVHSEHDAERLRRMAGDHRIEFVVFDKAPEHLLGRNPARLYIDNVDIILAGLLGRPADVVTFSTRSDRP